MTERLRKRVEALEATPRDGGSREEQTVYVCLSRPDEATEEAVMRHRAERPDTPERARFVVVDTGVYRTPGSTHENR